MPTPNSLSPTVSTESVMPVLSRGKHRNARRGACFMEFASYLAGERWSDHPACTHPALASLARLVNDWTPDNERQRLTSMIPSVIGLVGDDERVELLLAVRAAAAALPIANEARQRALAVGLTRCAIRLDDVDPDDAARLRAIIRGALDQAPLAERWAKQHLAAMGTRGPRSFAPMYDAIVNVSVAGIGEACAPDPAARLRQLLSTSIDESRRMLQRASFDDESGVAPSARVVRQQLQVK